jgi:hypothetical protein
MTVLHVLYGFPSHLKLWSTYYKAYRNFVLPNFSSGCKLIQDIKKLKLTNKLQANEIYLNLFSWKESTKNLYRTLLM